MQIPLGGNKTIQFHPSLLKNITVEQELTHIKVDSVDIYKNGEYLGYVARAIVGDKVIKWFGNETCVADAIRFANDYNLAKTREQEGFKC